jgi:hypothetical protein
MERDILRRAVAVAIATIVGAGTLVVGAGPAVAGTRKAAGRYTATFPDTSQTSKLVITNAAGSTTSGTFAFTDFGDYGTWVAQGTTVGLSVSVSNSGHTNAVLIGKLTLDGIGPAAIGQPGVGVHAWSATRISAASASTSTAATTTSATLRRTRRFAAAGTVYHAVFNGTEQDTLTVTKDSASKSEGTFTVTIAADAGTWLKLGKKIVLGTMSGDSAGTVLIGTQTTTGISSATAPGVYYQSSSGTHPWYATKS